MSYTNREKLEREKRIIRFNKVLRWLHYFNAFSVYQIDLDSFKTVLVETSETAGVSESTVEVVFHDVYNSVVGESIDDLYWLNEANKSVVGQITIT